MAVTFVRHIGTERIKVTIKTIIEMLIFRFMQPHDICDIIFIEKYLISNDYNCVKRHLSCLHDSPEYNQNDEQYYGFVSIFLIEEEVL